MKLPSTPWWLTDSYDQSEPLPQELKDLAPYGPALVSVYSGGKTQAGWGTTDNGAGTFMSNFQERKFNHRPKIHRLKTKGEPFALVMRAFKAICIDIDGKNGGIVGASQLGLLPPTLAETSKSGNGYHLFYELDETWDDELGFASLSDIVGLVEGVDIRATGCVYHHTQQRWNSRPVAPIPAHLLQRFSQRHTARLAAASRTTKIINEGDEIDMAMLHKELEEELAKPIAAGARNNTLFAIGSKMYASGYDDWQTMIENRGYDLGLDVDEVNKLVKNIEVYGN